MVSIENADVTFTHCILRYCSADAIKIYPGGKETTQALRLLADPLTEVYWSQLVAAGGYAINNSSGQPVRAAYNWWGAASGPTDDNNPGGTGSALNGPVHYWPYRTATDSKFIFMPVVIRTQGR